MARSPASRTVSLLFRSAERDKGRLLTAVLLALLSASSGVVTPLLVARLLTGLHGGSGAVGTVALLIAVVLLGAFAGGWSAYLLSTVGERAVAGVRRSLLRHAVLLPVPTLRRLGSGELLARLGGDAAQLRTLTDTGVTALPVSAVLVAAYMVVMGVLDWLLLVVVVVTFAVASLTIRAFLRRMRAGTVAQQTAVGRLAQAAQSVLDTVTTIKAFTAERRALAPIEEQIDEAASAGMRTARSQASVSPLMGLAQQIAIVAVLAVGGAELAGGRLGAAPFIAFLMYLFQLVNPLMTLAQGAGRIQVGLAAAARIDAVLAEPAEHAAPPHPAEALPTVGLAAPAPTPALRLSGVRLTIGDTRVLTGLDLEIPRTGLVAVVGASGAGKTTLIDVLERFVVPESGEITLLGTDLRRWPLAESRRRLAVVEQAGGPLRASVRFNLQLAVPDDRLASLTDDTLYAALAQVGLEDTVRALPSGLDTVLLESARLSGGEIQRLAIARALLRDADVLLLDEPTSALDGVNERRVVSLLSGLADTRAVVVIAHRISTVQDAHTVVVMDSGRVLAQGDHAGLLASCPHYRSLVSGFAADDDADSQLESALAPALAPQGA